MRYWVTWVWLLASPVVVAQDRARPPVTGMEELLKRFTDVYSVMESEAADPINSEQAVYQGAIPGLLRRLDPHSIFFDPDQFEQLKQLERSTSKGFGSVVSVLPGRVIILQTMPGTPSARSGLSPGDEILAINNIPLARLDMDQLIQLLTMSRQQQAKLDVKRAGNARLLSFLMTPEEVASPAVDRYFAIRPGIAYVRVSSFEKETGEQLQKAIEELGGEKLKGLVLDLRNNPGGVLPAALEVCSMLLPPDTKILSVRGRSKETEEVRVPKSAKPYAFGVTVLINAKSASASEIVAGAVQDHDRGQVLGETSFGKGLVQGVYPLSASAGMALTTAYYYTPSGRSIQKPLSGGTLDEVTAAPQPEFKTAKGRTVRGGGGIQPDETIEPEGVTRFRAVMDGSGILTTFATMWMLKNKADDKFEVSGQLLDELRVFLSESKIRPSTAEWVQEREWVTSRLKQEVLNQAVGVHKGDEVELNRDPVVKRALRVLGVE